MKVKLFLAVEAEIDVQGSVLEDNKDLDNSVSYAKHLILSTEGTGVKFKAVEFEQAEEISHR